MKTVLLFGMFSPFSSSFIEKNTKGHMDYAADALQKSFFEGLGCHIKDLETINLPYIGSYPSRFRTLFTKSGGFVYETQNGNCIKGKDVGFCNLSGYKQYSRCEQARKALMTWCNKYPEEEKAVVVYAIHFPFLKACVDVKNKIGKSLKIILIVPDLPEFMNDKVKWPKSKLLEMNQHKLSVLYPEVDAFVLLSKYMVDRLPVGNKPWAVVEGIFNFRDEDTIDVSSTVQDKFILYTGTLAQRYGVMNLVEAFAQTDNHEYKLVICGIGGTDEQIKKYAEKDKRIIFKGQIPRLEVLKLQRQATLLVNPRTPEGEFTKYSFPSKTMEYMASGTPCLLYRLPGIPEEYFNYCFTIEELGVDALKQKMESIMAMSKENLVSLGQRARTFILENKNPLAQTSKVIKLLESL